MGIQTFFTGKKMITSKQKYIWYTLGSGSLAFSTMFITIIVSHILGEYVGGYFSIGISLAQWFSTIANFEIRTFQVTDVKKEYSFFDYFLLHFVLCIVTFGISGIYLLSHAYSAEKSMIIFLLCVYKLLEAAADVYEGEFQKMERIDLSGKSMFFRVVISLLTLSVSMLLTHDSILSLFLMCVFTLIVIYLLNVKMLYFFGTYPFGSTFQRMKGIFFQCLPLAIATFLNTYIINSSKFMIDQYMDDRYQLYYTAVFMPNLVINLFSGIIFKPMQIKMAKYCLDNEYHSFASVIIHVLSLIIGFTILCMAGAYVAGLPVLSFVYKVDLNDYRQELLILLAAGGINAINIIFYYVMTIIRKQKYMIAIYGASALFAYFMTRKTTQLYGIMGAAAGYLSTVIFLGLLLITTCLILMKKEKQNNE